MQLRITRLLTMQAILLSHDGTPAESAVMAATNVLRVVRAMYLRGHLSAFTKLAVKRTLLEQVHHPLREECLVLLDKCYQTKFYHGYAQALERLFLNQELAVCYDLLDALSGHLGPADPAAPPPDSPDGARSPLRPVDPELLKDIRRLANAGQGPLWLASDRPPTLSMCGSPLLASLSQIRAALDAGKYTSRQQCLNDIEVALRSLERPEAPRAPVS